MNGLNVVLKVTERCNLNCSYCYYFNGLDNSFKSKPSVISIDVVDKVVDFLLQGIRDYSIEVLLLTLHGGEPLLLKKQNFETICYTLKNKLAPYLKHFQISVQTNGTLITDEWIQLFKKYQIKLGISLDGSKANHDKYRVMHKGHGSYDRIIQSIKLLRQQNYDFGILSVIDPSYPAEEMFEQLIIPFNIDGIDFLWPDFTHDHPSPHPPNIYGNYITDLFNYWVKYGNSEIQIRFFNSHVNLMLGKEGLTYSQGIFPNCENLTHVLAIRSDGEICPTDELMSTDPQTYATTGKTVYNSSMKDIFALPVFKELTDVLLNAPKKCQSCCWKVNCGGGKPY